VPEKPDRDALDEAIRMAVRRWRLETGLGENPTGKRAGQADLSGLPGDVRQPDLLSEGEAGEVLADLSGCSRGADQQDSGLAEVMHVHPLHDPALRREENRGRSSSLGERDEVCGAQSVQEVERVRATGDQPAEMGAVGQGASTDRGVELGFRRSEMKRPAGPIAPHGPGF
jgi:hypothetical protein